MVLAITVLGSGTAAHDATVVSIALPTIGRDFLTSLAARQWGDERLHADACRIPADRRSLGDRLGRRTIYLVGIAWFAPTSAACGFAPDVVFLIITRALQGAGAAC
jgi:hypothetical protein